MSKNRKLYDLEIEYENLSGPYKAIYDELGLSLQDMSVLEIKHFADDFGIKIPTSCVKEELVDYTVGRVLMPFMPPSERICRKLWDLFKEGDNEIIRGFCELRDGEWYVGRVVIFPPLAKLHDLREGDKIEGLVGDLNGIKMLVTIISLESDGIERKLFSDIHVLSGGRMCNIEGTVAGELLSGLRVGERVIMRDMSLDLANSIAQSFTHSVRLFIDFAPEFESDMEREIFVAEFSLGREEKLAIARLSVERCKRLAERGREVTLVVMGFDTLQDSDIERSIIGAGRCFDTGGLTVIVQMSEEKNEEYKTIATRIV